MFTRLVCRASIEGISPKVRDLGGSDAGGVVRVGTDQKMGEERQNGSFDSSSKICYNCVWLSWERSTPLHSGVSHTH